MAAYFDGLQMARFGNVYFPVESVSLDGAQRHRLHEYPHTPGARLEKLGRRAWVFKVTPIFDESIFKYDLANGTTLYPEALENLQLLFENEKSELLTIPTLGTILAFMTNFSRKMSAAVRSGENVELEFVEDMNEQFRLQEAIREGSASVASKLKLVMNLKAIKATESAVLQREEDNLFDKIDKAVNKVLAVQDQAELALSQVESRIATLTGYLSEADRRLTRLQDPNQWPLLDAIKDLWMASIQLTQTSTFSDFQAYSYEVPRVMTVQEVSQAIFGTTSRSMELLQSNVIEDASAIPPGTIVQYREESKLVPK